MLKTHRDGSRHVVLAARSFYLWIAKGGQK